MFMQTLPEIDFQGMEPSSELRDRIEEIGVKGLGGRHQTGGLYELNIYLVLPDGREAVIERTPHLDERSQDFDFALNDAFKRAPAAEG